MNLKQGSGEEIVILMPDVVLWCMINSDRFCNWWWDKIVERTVPMYEAGEKRDDD